MLKTIGNIFIRILWIALTYIMVVLFVPLVHLVVASVRFVVWKSLEVIGSSIKRLYQR